MDKLPTSVKQKPWISDGDAFDGDVFDGLDSTGPLVRRNGDTVNLSNRLRFRYRQVMAMLQQILLHGPNISPVMTYLARNGSAGHIRLQAACRFKDNSMIVFLAYDAAEVDIRLKAAVLSKEQAALAAIALDAWDIGMGEEAVTHISNRFLLMRITRTARQDAIRLAAALKLQMPDLLGQLASTTSDVHVLWRIACILKDPYLMARVAGFKTSNIHFAPLRHKAQLALLDHFDRLQRQGDQSALISQLLTHTNPGIIVEVFLRLAIGTLAPTLLHHLASQNFEHVKVDLIQAMLGKIGSAGWGIWEKVKPITCPYCCGKGLLSDRSIIIHQRRYDSEVLPCSECNAMGKISQNIVTCSSRTGESVLFHLPLGAERTN